MTRKRIYDSMAAAAMGAGIPIEVLRRAKKLGCLGFRGGRVNAKDVRKFIADHASEIASMGDAKNLKDSKLNEEIRKLRIRNDRDEGKLVLRAQVAESIRRILGPVREILESKLVNEYPSAVAGLDVPQARIYGKRLHDEVMKKFQELGEEWKT